MLPVADGATDDQKFKLMMCAVLTLGGLVALILIMVLL